MNKKKFIIPALCLSVTIALAGCSTHNVGYMKDKKATEIAGLTGIIQDSLAKNDEGNSDADSTSFEDVQADVDFTALPQAELYEAMYGLIHLPVDYEGKKVKLNGECHIYYDKLDNRNQYFCVIPETVLYKQQEINLSFDETNNAKSQELPEDGDFITVIGTVSQIKQGGTVQSGLSSVCWKQFDSKTIQGD